MAVEIIKDVSIRQREVTAVLPWDEVKFVLSRRALEIVGLWNPEAEAEDGTGGATVNVVVALDDNAGGDGLRVRATVDITASIA